MSDFDSLSESIAATFESVAAQGDAQRRFAEETAREIGRLWAEHADLGDELHDLANRVETLTRARLTEPAETAARMVDGGQGFTCTQVGCYLRHPHEHHHADGHIIVRGDAA